MAYVGADTVAMAKLYQKIGSELIMWYVIQTVNGQEQPVLNAMNLTEPFSIGWKNMGIVMILRQPERWQPDCLQDVEVMEERKVRVEALQQVLQRQNLLPVTRQIPVTAQPTKLQR